MLVSLPSNRIIKKIRDLHDLTSVQRKGDGEEATQHFKVSKGNEGEGLAAEKSL